MLWLTGVRRRRRRSHGSKLFETERANKMTSDGISLWDYLKLTKQGMGIVERIKRSYRTRPKGL